MATSVKSWMRCGVSMSRSAPGLLVVGPALLDAERLGGGDLHVVDEAAVPDRLEDGVGEAQHQEILHRLLGEVVIDAVHLPLAEGVVR